MSNIHYQDELRYLRDVGPEFARANPQIARFLADPGLDPDVERLLEGVAFLCGRIREKLDDELPEITASMMALLWPHYLRPIPSVSILELKPDLDAMQAPLLVEAGAEFASISVEGTSCRYRSCWPVKLRPWWVEDVRLESEAAKPVRLIIRLRKTEKVDFETLDLDTVRFHLAGDPQTSFFLYLLLAAHVDHFTVCPAGTGHNREEVRLEAEHVKPGGLDRNEGLLPYGAGSFTGYRLLQEYFAFKERFLFVDISGLASAASKLESAEGLNLSITFNRRFDSYPLVSRENVRLHCVPIINLFAHCADPIRLKNDRTQYLVRPSRTGVADANHLEVFSIDEVHGISQTEGVSSHRYAPFYSFQHTAGDPREATYYQMHVSTAIGRQKARQSTQTHISFVQGTEANQHPVEETISIELTCTNRDLPGALGAGDICKPTDSSPPTTTFKNLQRPTPTICPPLGKSLHWRLISHMTLNYVSLTNVDHFKELMRVYDFQSENDAQQLLVHQRMLEGILTIQTEFDERLIRGAIVRGSQIQIELNEDHFAGEGDAYLFSSILDRFMGLYATVNAYTQLTARFSRSGQVYSFSPRWGEQLTPAEAKQSA